MGQVGVVEEESILHGEMLKSFDHDGKVVNLVIDYRGDGSSVSDRRTQQGGTCWIHHLGTWDCRQNGVSRHKLGADHLGLLMVQMQAQL